jgi:hypothetical protein
MTYTCPVCGFDNLDEAPERYAICPCCGVEFGNDDEMHSHEDLRRKWVTGGMKWWSTSDRPPATWNPDLQLRSLGELQRPRSGVKKRASEEPVGV